MLRRRPLRTPAVAVLAVATLLTAGCGGSDDAADARPSAPTTTFAFPQDELVDETGKAVVEISAIDNSLEPRYVEITVGTRVVWKNEGRNPHDILPAVDGAFAGATAAEIEISLGGATVRIRGAVDGRTLAAVLKAVRVLA